MESLKWLFSGASRPIRRGPVFKNPQPIKQSFFRHFGKVRTSLGLHQLQFDYWTSASKTKGVLINIAKGITLSSEYSLKLVKVNDGLKHRLTIFCNNTRTSNYHVVKQYCCFNLHTRGLNRAFFLFPGLVLNGQLTT